jgi:hypothetical protein
MRLRLADEIEARGDLEKADLIRKLAKDRFRAMMTYGTNRSFARRRFVANASGHVQTIILFAHVRHRINNPP